MAVEVLLSNMSSMLMKAYVVASLLANYSCPCCASALKLLRLYGLRKNVSLTTFFVIDIFPAALVLASKIRLSMKWAAINIT